MKRIRQPLDWNASFLIGQGHGKHLIRTMHVGDHDRREVRIDVAADLSPYGLGAFRYINGGPTEWFAVDTAKSNAKKLRVPFAHTLECQQAYEA